MHIFIVYCLVAIVGLLPFFASPVRAQLATPASATAHYIHQPGNGGAAKTIVLSLDGPFTADEAARILQAGKEWNYALNGFLRLDLVAAGRGGADSWAIHAQKGGTPRAPDPAVGQPLASSQSGFLGIGGRMLVYVDRIGTRDLRGIALHEFGHVLGLNHDQGRLMSARYSPTKDQCIDRVTMETVAARHNLPIAHLNWCEPALSSAR